jgi:hypothetical protein
MCESQRLGPKSGSLAQGSVPVLAQADVVSVLGEHCHQKQQERLQLHLFS